MAERSVVYAISTDTSSVGKTVASEFVRGYACIP
jgi:hypothetical protein